MDFAFDIELVALDLDHLLALARLLDNQAHLGQVRVDLRERLVHKLDVVLFAEGFEVVSLLEKSALNFKHVQKCGTSQLLRVGSQQNVFICFLFDCVSQLARSIEIKLVKESLCELSE